MKLWDKGYSIQEKVEAFTVGNDRDLDQNLAKFDLLGSLAHAEMLFSIGILTSQEWKDVERELSAMLREVETGVFQIEEEFEDIHSKVEHELTQRIGAAGKKIHTARSRNDQVLVDLHLYAKSELSELRKEVGGLFDTLIQLSEEHKSVLLPGYTHLQVAMPSSFGLWFGAYAETLVDDVILLKAAYRIADQNPLGSAAGYGSSFPINRTMTTQKLGFSTLRYNAVAAQMSRGRLEKTVANASASLGSTLGKMADDLCLYMSQNFDFVSLPSELTTGSSIMPHKQNPDVFELIRAKSNVLQSIPMELALITTNMSSGYHRDYQLLKEPFMRSLTTARELVQMMDYMLSNLQVKPSVVEEKKYDFLFSVDTLNEKVMSGQTFREAYAEMGKAIMEGKFQANRKVHHTHEGSIGNLCNREIVEKMKAAW